MLHCAYCVVIYFDLTNAYDNIFHMGLLYKLSRMGVRGRLLHWLREFLSDRTFQVYFEGSLSAVCPITSGVPQGAVLSPTLFNVMLSDIPSAPHVHVAEYADDLAIFANGWNYESLCRSIQVQVDRLHAWTQRWGFTLNPVKTKGMVFSLLSHATPVVRLGNEVIDFVGRHKYLGLHFDSPRLSWKSHISYLREACLGKVNMLKSISGSYWGADREILLQFYTSFVRSKLDYGSVFYSTASKSALVPLDKIQNMCLRIALGVRKTSPILSIEAESNIPPLSVHRNRVLFNYFMRLIDLPSGIPVVSELLQSFHKFSHIQWTPPIRAAPLFIRARTLLLDYKFPYNVFPSSSLLSSYPPWFALNNLICTDFIALPVRYTSPLTAQQMMKHILEEKYKDFCAIYTDGSLTIGEEASVGAAMVVWTGTGFMAMCWKLSRYSSVLGAELYAIYRALKYVKVNRLISVPGVVICSDSKSSLDLIMNSSPSNYVSLIYDIHGLLLELNDRFPVLLQFVPGHKGITGNERADQEAKLAHDLDIVTPFPLSAQDKKYHFSVLLIQSWQAEWERNVQESGKGRFLRCIKPVLGFWPWASHSSRLVETTLAKLRIGHANVALHLYRFEKLDTPQCSCGATETIEHMFLLCPTFSAQRLALQQSLNSINIPCSLVNLLGGGP